MLAKYRTADDSLMDTVTVNGSMFPTALVLSANDDTAYVCDFTNAAGRIHRYDVSGTNLTFLDSNLQSGIQGHDIDISADGSRLVAAGFNSDELTFVDIGGGSGVTPYLLIDGSSAFGTAPAAYGPYGVNFNQAGTKAVAACRKGVDQIRIMDIANPTQIDSIVIPVMTESPANEATVGPTLMIQKPNSNVFFVTGLMDNRLYVVDIEALSVLDTIPFATSRPFTVDINSAGTRVYVSTTNTRPGLGRIYVLDAATYAKIDSVEVGSEPFGFAWRP
jgi:YVTN family beta-propeller protein